VNLAARLGSLLALVLIWQVAAHFADPRLLPGPAAVLLAIRAQTASGDLPFALAVTIARVAAAFALAMAAGSALGYAMGRREAFNRWFDAPVVILLNLPALVIIVLAYIWIGLNEAAAIGAVALNKLPNTVVTMREGARTLDVGLDEMAAVFAFPPYRRWRHVVLPQLAPFFAAATRSGLSLVWKIVLVVELLGRPNGVGFEIGSAFQLFDVATLLAYALPFTVIMLAVESLIVQPFERHVSRWRPRPARS
jgi:NitT/TauT family transport system permease protein